MHFLWTVWVTWLTLVCSIDLKSKNGYIELNDSSFRKLTKGAREHYSVVLLTALNPQFDCAFCQEFDPEFKTLASSWERVSKNAPEVYFGHLDFDAGKEIFRALKLVSAPNLWIFPPTIDANGKAQESEPIRYDFGTAVNADAAAHWIGKTVGYDFKVIRPFDYLKAAKFAASIGSVIFSAFVLFRIAGFIFTNKYFWALVSISAILIFNGGYMFTQIRNSPYSRGTDYIAGGFQDQFGAEVWIVAGTYAVLAFSTITLAISAPRMSNSHSQTVMVIVWGGIQLFVFSFLMQLFRQKNGGYPFKLLL